MLKKFYSMIFVLFLFLFTNCSTESLFDQIATNDIIPEEETIPIVKSFEIEHAIVVEWEKDDGAEEYILYRSTDPSAGYTSVYSGGDLTYTDTSVIDETFYYYKLAKKRGTKEFDKSRYVCGVANDKRKDDKENNDTRANAKPFDLSLGKSMQLNISYYKDDYGNSIEDTDWFYAVIPGSTNFEINIVGTDNLISNQDLILYIEDDTSSTIVFTNNYTLQNTDADPKRVYFRISVDKDIFIDGDPSSSDIGKIGLYTITFLAMS